MAFEFKLPDIGEGLAEGEIVRWLVKEGDAVKEDQPLVEVMTDKATVEITSPRTGKISKLLAKEGQTVAVHSTIVIIEEGATNHPSPSGVAVSAARKVAETATPAGYSTNLANSPIQAVSQRVLAAPAVRMWARNQGIDLHHIRGSGPNGRVLRSDVEIATKSTRPSQAGEVPVTATFLAAGTGTSPAAYATRGGPVREVPVRGLRKRIAQQMVRSKQHAPHFTYVEEVDMTAIVELRKKLKPQMEKRGISVTYLPFIFKALLPALKAFPQCNASLDEERQVLTYKEYFNFGISVASEEGLVVPVVKQVDKLDVWQIAAELARLSTAVRERKIKSEEMQDSTITVTSIGSIGGILATPVLNYPESAIIGVNKIRETPVVRSGQIVVRHMMYLSSSFDHRVVDGDIAAKFTNELVRALEEPAALGPVV